MLTISFPVISPAPSGAFFQFSSSAGAGSPATKAATISAKIFFLLYIRILHAGMATSLKCKGCANSFSRAEQWSMKLLVQPGDGVLPLVQAINNAKKSVEIVIFRFDRSEV